MSPDQRLVVTQKYRRVTVMLCVDLENRSGLQVAQEYPTFNLRLDNIVVHFIAQVGVRVEHRDLQVLVHGVVVFTNQ